MKNPLDLPPVLQIATEEQLWRFSTPSELAKHLRRRGVLTELRRQSLWTRKHYLYDDDPDFHDIPGGDFVITPTGSLNPFSPVAKCNDHGCRAKNAEDFLRSIALYSDIAYVHDPITGPFAREGKIDSSRVAYIHQSLQVLRIVLPLVESGILRFASPYQAYCQSCYERIDDLIEGATDSLSEALYEEIWAQYWPHKQSPALSLHTPVLYPQSDHPLVTVCELTGEEHQKYTSLCGTSSTSKRTRKCRRYLTDLFRDRLERAVTSIFMEIAVSRRTHSLLLAGSRLEPLVLARLDKESPSPADLADWEAVRSIELPFLHQLTADELLVLRSKADRALPRLRELLLTKVSTPSGRGGNVRSVVEELRSQVVEVEQELAGLRLPRERRYQVGMGALSLTLVLYGLASAVPEAAVGSVAALMAMLAHLHHSEQQHDAAVTKLESSPAYALLKGRQIVEDRIRSG